MRQRRSAPRSRVPKSISRAYAKYQRGAAKAFLRYPPSSYGRAYIKRGTSDSLSAYGATFREASEHQKVARRATGFVGRGDYSAALRNIGRYGIRGAGAVLGAASGYANGGFGGALSGGYGGWNSGAQMSKMVGLGDYQSNQIVGGSGHEPMSVNKAEGDLSGDVYINHREFLGNIQADAANTFQNRSFPINAGLASTFPFLSQIAQNFTLYEFEGLIFEFVTTSGETSTGSNSLGKVIMAVDYDPNASPFVNPVQMSNMDYAVSGKPSVNLVCGVETKPSQMATKMQYVRTGKSSRDLIFSDIGTFQIATDGLPSSGIAGELWVSYRVRLSRAQLSTTGFGSSIQYDAFVGRANASDMYGNSAALISGRQLVGYTVPAGELYNRFTFGGDYMNGQLSTTGKTVFTYKFPESVSSGAFCVTMRLEGNPNIGPTNNPTFAFTNLRSIDRTNFPQGAAVGDFTGRATTFVLAFGTLVYAVEVTAAKAIFQITMNVALNTDCDWTFYVTQLNYSSTGNRVIN